MVLGIEVYLLNYQMAWSVVNVIPYFRLKPKIVKLKGGAYF